MPDWLTFLLSATAIAAAGVRLARDGDLLAEGTGLGGMWMGAIVIAATTSLPELSTGANAVLQGHHDLAVGDLLGACMANMLILAVADLVTRGPRILTRVAVNQALVGTLGVSLATIAALGILLDRGRLPFPIGWPSAVIAFTYVAGMRLLHVNRIAPPFRTEAQVDAVRPTRAQMRPALARFLVAAVVIIVAAPALAASTADLAARLGISESFAGTVLLALTTTLPETAVTAGSIRAGAFGLAVGNLFGSNCFNVAALVVFDVLYAPGSLLAATDDALAVAALFGSLLTALAILEVLNKSEKRIWIIEPGPAFMLLTYAIGLVALFTATHP